MIFFLLPPPCRTQIPISLKTLTTQPKFFQFFSSQRVLFCLLFSWVGLNSRWRIEPRSSRSCSRKGWRLWEIHARRGGTKSNTSNASWLVICNHLLHGLLSQSLLIGFVFWYCYLYFHRFGLHVKCSPSNFFGSSLPFLGVVFVSSQGYNFGVSEFVCVKSKILFYYFLCSSSGLLCKISSENPNSRSWCFFWLYLCNNILIFYILLIVPCFCYY